MFGSELFLPLSTREKFAAFLNEKKTKAAVPVKKIKTVIPVKKTEVSSGIPEDKYETPMLVKSISSGISAVPNYTKYIIIGIISLLVYKSLKKGW